MELLDGSTGRDFVLYGKDGDERFSARLLDPDTTLRISWTDNLPRIGFRLREVQWMAGGIGSFNRITGMASDQLERSIRAGTFDPNKAAEILGAMLTGRGGVAVIPRSSVKGVLDIVAERFG